MNDYHDEVRVYEKVDEEVEKLAKKLKKVSVQWSDLNTGYFDWIEQAKAVQRMILEARIDEVEIEKERFKDTVPLWTHKERIEELTKQLRMEVGKS